MTAHEHELEQVLFPGILPRTERDARKDICNHPVDRQQRDGTWATCLDCGTSWGKVAGEWLEVGEL